MPLQTVDATLFMKYKGVSIYHTYRHQDFDMPAEYWYSLSTGDDTGYEFDVRLLDAYAYEVKNSSWDSTRVLHEIAIRAAIDAGELDELIKSYYGDFCEEFDPEEPPYIVAQATVLVRIPVRGDKLSSDLYELGAACAKVLQSTLDNELENNPIDLLQDLDDAQASALDGEAQDVWTDREYEIV